MPFLIRYPRGIEACLISNCIATNVDFAPTFLDYAKAPIPSYMQGHSLRPVLEDKPGPSWQTSAYHRYWMHKDEFHNAFAHYGLRNQRYKLIYWYNAALDQAGAGKGDEPPEWELFDCKTDPLELFNLVDSPEHAAIFQIMLGELDAKMAEIGDIPEHDSQMVLASRLPE